jgi:hypothetical protein
MDFFTSPRPLNAFVYHGAHAFRHARTARMRWERVAFLKAAKSGARRDNSVVSAGVPRSVSVNPKNSAMQADEEIPASIM